MNLCVFIHFGRYSYIPMYVEIYLKELVSHFDQLIFVTNEREVLPGVDKLSPKIRILWVKNEGYDLGMFYKAFQTIDLESVHQIACINDSNVLFNHLNPIMSWGQGSGLDFWGIIDSRQKPWFSTHHDNFHLQSHFLVFGKRAIKKLPFFFNSLNMKDLLEEKNQKKLRRTIINQWEIGLTQFFLQEKLEIGSFIESERFSQRHKIKDDVNLSHRHYSKLIEEGYPFLKKKVIFNRSGLIGLLDRHKRWDELILQHGNKNWKIREMIEDLKQLKGR